MVYVSCHDYHYYLALQDFGCVPWVLILLWPIINMGMSHNKDDFCYSQWFGKMVNFSCLHIDPFDGRLVCFLACTLMPLIPPHMSTNAFNRNVHLYTSLYSSSSFSLLKNNPSQISRLLITIPPLMPYATKTITSIGKDEI